MKPLHVAFVCASAFAGCMAGSWLALHPTLQAKAQAITISPTPGQGLGQRTNVQVEDSIVIPDGGLRLTDMRRNTVGYFGITESGLSLVMLTRSGQPGVRLEAGPGGQVLVGGSQQDAGVLVQNSAGSRARMAVAGGRMATLTLQRQDRVLSAEIGEETTLSIPGRTRAPIAEISSNRDGGQLRLITSGGKDVLKASSAGNAGALELLSGAGPSRVLANGKGEFKIFEGDEVKWEAGKSADSKKEDEKPGPPGLPPMGQRGVQR